MQVERKSRIQAEATGTFLAYPSLDQPAATGAEAAAQAGNPQLSAINHSQQQDLCIDDDDLLDDLDIPTDAQATVILLRSQLYPDPAAAAAAAAAAKQSRHAKRSKSAPGPSKAAAAAVVAAAAAATAARQLPPIILKSQLYTVLADRTAVDRDLEELRRQGKARVFKLAIGADEYVVLLTEDYLSIIDSLVTKHTQLAHQLQQEETERLAHQQEQQRARQQHQQHQHQQQCKQQQQQPEQEQEQEQQEANDGSGGSKSSAEHAAIAHTLQLFRTRVIPACQESHITRSQLLQLMRTSPAAAGQHTQHPQPHQPAAAVAAANGRGASAKTTGSADTRSGAPSAEDIQRHLLSAELVCRGDSKAPNSYVFTVPGAAAFVKSVVEGRKELLQLLSRKKYQEVLEKELACVKLRGSCLTTSFHLRDMQGRGLVACIDTTAGKLVRLVKRK